MKASERYACFEKFFFRTPLLPSCQDFDFTKSSLFIESIYLASNDLYHRLIGQDSTLRDIKFDNSVLKYFRRMKFRCVPFGHFASVGIGSIGDKSEIVIEGPTSFTTRTRLDMELLNLLCQQISQIEEFRLGLLFFPNSSLYKIANRYRYTEYKFQDGVRKYFLSEVENSEELSELLKLTKSGLNRTAIILSLTKSGFEISDATAFVDNLINEQILVSEIENNVVGTSPFTFLLERINAIRPTHPFTIHLNLIAAELKSIDALPLGDRIGSYEKIVKNIKLLAPNVSHRHILQSDLICNPLKATLSKDVINRSMECFDLLNVIAPFKESSLLVRFMKDFYNRYEEEEVPLVEALDADLGIGFGSSLPENNDINDLLAGLSIDATLPTESNTGPESEIQKYIIDKYFSCLTAGSRELIIDPIYIEKYNQNCDDLPETMSCMLELIETKDPTGSTSRTILMSSVFMNAANLMSRFSDANKEIYNGCLEIVEADEKAFGDGVVVAEIIHLPESRLGNVLSRPSFRKFEIPYLGNSMKPEGSQIEIDDIMVSVPGGRDIRLRSRKLNKRIVPRLLSAHNYNNKSLPLYEFLCVMQNVGTRAGLSFSWPSTVRAREYFPRVTYKNIVIAPERWILSKDDLLDFKDRPVEQFLKAFEDFKSEKRLADKVLIVEGDNRLFLDLTEKKSIELLCREYAGKIVMLDEALYESNDNLIRTKEGLGHTNQVIISFYKKQLEG